MIVAAAVAAYVAFVAHERHVGAQHYHARIVAHDKAATKAADTAESRIRECYASGRVYDDATGRCAGS
jgi:hypothetical protein